MFRFLTNILQTTFSQHQTNAVIASIGGAIVALLVLALSIAAVKLVDMLWTVSINSSFHPWAFVVPILVAIVLGALFGFLLLRRTPRQPPEIRTGDGTRKKLHQLQESISQHEERTGRTVSLPPPREATRPTVEIFKGRILAAIEAGSVPQLAIAEQLVDDLATTYPNESAWAAQYRQNIQELKKRL
jgi:hypothetical protein